MNEKKKNRCGTLIERKVVVEGTHQTAGGHGDSLHHDRVDSFKGDEHE